MNVPAEVLKTTLPVRLVNKDVYLFLVPGYEIVKRAEERQTSLQGSALTFFTAPLLVVRRPYSNGTLEIVKDSFGYTGVTVPVQGADRLPMLKTLIETRVEKFLNE